MNEKGSIVLGFTFTIMIAVAITFYFKETELQSQMNTIRRESLVINLDMARYAIERAFEDPLVVANTFHAMANQTGTVGLLECLSNPNVSCDNTEKDLTLYSQIPGKLFVNPAALSSGKYIGLSLKSTTCTQPECVNLVMKDFSCDTYDPGNPTDDCHFRLRTTWKPLCPLIGNCRKPRIIWMLKLEILNVAGTKSTPINPQRYYVEKVF